MVDARELAREAGIDILELELDCPGHLSISDDGSLAILWLGSNYSKQEQNWAALHELEHYLLQRDETALYKATVAARTQMESEINRSVITEQLTSYTTNNDLEPDQVNYANFMQSFKIPDCYTDYVKATLAGMQKVF